MKQFVANPTSRSDGELFRCTRHGTATFILGSRKRALRSCPQVVNPGDCIFPDRVAQRACANAVNIVAGLQQKTGRVDGPLGGWMPDDTIASLVAVLDVPYHSLTFIGLGGSEAADEQIHGDLCRVVQHVKPFGSFGSLFRKQIMSFCIACRCGNSVGQRDTRPNLVVWNFQIGRRLRAMP